MSTFDALIPDTLDFLDRLGRNNTREWFADHKDEWEAKVKHPAERLRDAVTAWFDEDTGRRTQAKIYRINRDLRFTPDKSPYNTHLHMEWGDPITGVAHFFGISPRYVAAGAGVMSFVHDQQDLWRARVGHREGDALAAEFDSLMARNYRAESPALKRVPPPGPQDHPRGDLLRRNGLVVWYDLGPEERAQPLETLCSVFGGLQVFCDALEGVITP